VKRREAWRKSSKSAVKWSEVKCSDVGWNGAVGISKCVYLSVVRWSLNGNKLSVLSVVKWGDGISQRMFIVITRYFVCCLYGCFITFLYSFGSILYHCVHGCMLCVLLCNLYKLLLCILIVMYVPYCVFCFIVLFCVLFVCKCVLYCCHRASTQLKLTKYIISYTISWRWRSKYLSKHSKQPNLITCDASRPNSRTFRYLPSNLAYVTKWMWNAEAKFVNALR
jgi:predicted PurR-regulated permease PerM